MASAAAVAALAPVSVEKRADLCRSRCVKKVGVGDDGRSRRGAADAASLRSSKESIELKTCGTRGCLLQEIGDDILELH